MKQVILLRHGVADMSHKGSDKDRPLLSQGKKDMAALAEWMREGGHVPGYVFCSPVRRTRDTFALVTSNFSDIGVDYAEAIYNADVSDLFEVLKSANDAHELVLLIGHNPGIHGLAMLLAGPGNLEMRQKLALGYRPGTISIFQCSCDSWSELQPGLNDIENVLIPGEY